MKIHAAEENSDLFEALKPDLAWTRNEPVWIWEFIPENTIRIIGKFLECLRPEKPRKKWILTARGLGDGMYRNQPGTLCEMAPV